MIQNIRKQNVCLAAGLGLAIIVWNLGLDLTPGGTRCQALVTVCIFFTEGRLQYDRKGPRDKHGFICVTVKKDFPGDASTT